MATKKRNSVSTTKMFTVVVLNLFSVQPDDLFPMPETTTAECMLEGESSGGGEGKE